MKKGPVLIKLNERLQAENFQACFSCLSLLIITFVSITHAVISLIKIFKRLQILKIPSSIKMNCKIF